MRIFFLSLALGAKVGPVEKVLMLIRALRTQIKLEAKTETETYRRFERFCNEEIAEKQESIENGKTQRGTIEAELEQLHSRLAQAEQRARDARTELANIAARLHEELSRRKLEREEYKQSALDLTEAITAVRNAVDALEASRRTGENAGGGTGNNFLQTPSTLPPTMELTIRKAALIADGIGLTKSSGLVLALLEHRPANNRHDYEFHSDQILKTIKELQKDLVDEKTKLDKEEATHKGEHDNTVFRNGEDRDRTEKQLNDENKMAAAMIAWIGSSNRDLKDVNEKLHDDEHYLAKLQKNFDEKERTFNQRMQMREDEINALSEATDIIADTVVKMTTSQTVRLVHTHGAEMKQTEKIPESFLQLENKPLNKSKNQIRDQIANVLRRSSMRNSMPSLTTLASHVEFDPFVKIRGLIQAMITRLQDEAANDQEHNNYCIKNTKLAKQQRSIRSQEIAQLNADLEGDEARRAVLTQRGATLTSELQALEAAYEEAKKEREEEKKENEKAIADAKNGKGALKQAEDLLRRFYSERGAKGRVELTNMDHRNDYPDAPDAGFKNFEAYKGKQGAATGVLGVIETITSDFQRTIDTSEANELAAKAAFIKLFDGENKASQFEKRKLSEITGDNLTETKANISNNLDSLTESQSMLDKAIDELKDLYEVCVKTEMSYEERVARREDEIRSLKQALCILDNEGPVQTGEC